jgi:hypothetical protein
MTKNKIIIIVVVIIVGIMAYMYLTKGNDTAGVSLVAENKTTDIVGATDILALLNSMNQIKLDDSIFNDPVFQSLKDTTVTLVSMPTGRNNPFAPLGSDGTVVKSSNSSAPAKKTTSPAPAPTI